MKTITGRDVATLQPHEVQVGDITAYGIVSSIEVGEKSNGKCYYFETGFNTVITADTRDKDTVQVYGRLSANARESYLAAMGIAVAG